MRSSSKFVRASISLLVAMGVLASLLVVSAPALATGGGSSSPPEPRAYSEGDAAVTWLKTQQQADTGFEVAGYAGFETPDAVLAIAEQAIAAITVDGAADVGADEYRANPGGGIDLPSYWNTATARAAVAGLAGGDALDAVDDFVDSGINAGQAAKVVSNVAIPLGIDPTDFDPQNDSGSAVNLASTIDSGLQADDSYGTVNQTAAAVIAKQQLGAPASGDTVHFLRDTQQPHGGFHWGGDPTSTSIDIDTTGFVLEALLAWGKSPTYHQVAKAVSFLAQQQNADGSWDSFGSPDPNSTSAAVRALRAAGHDLTGRCWRDSADASTRSSAYVDPLQWLISQQQGDGRIVSPNDGWGINTFASSQTAHVLYNNYFPVSRSPHGCKTYDVAYANGGAGQDGVGPATGMPDTLAQPVVDGAGHPSGAGAWFAAGDGGIFALYGAGYFGSMGGLHLNSPIVGIAVTPTGNGYWLVAADGGIFAFGDAAFFGSMGGLHLNSPIVGIAVTPTGNGYWLVAADGGTFAFGDAAFFGSMGGLHLNSPVVAMFATPSGNGYVLIAADGGIFVYGDMQFFGSMGGQHLNSQIADAVTTQDGGGYHLFAADGGVFSFGNALFQGSFLGLNPGVAVVGAW